MSEGLQIGEHIYNNIPCGSRKDFSSFKDLEELFSSIPAEVQKLWPLDLSDMGYKTRYEQAQISSEQMGFVQNILLKAQVFNAEENYILKLKLSFEDDKLKLTHESMLQKKGLSGNNFANTIMKQSQKFLTAYDKTRTGLKKDDVSEIVLQARSAAKARPALRGGYVWANQGFDFATKTEQLSMRRAFKKFLSAYGVNMSDKDLNRFTKPCHFAAFGCGVPAEDAAGHKLHLGKAFMLEQSWQAKWTTAQPQAEEKRYALAYNQKGILPTSRRRKAIAKLSKTYHAILRKYYEHYARKRSQVSTLGAYKRLMMQKFKQLVGIAGR